jgi:signal peptidase I
MSANEPTLRIGQFFLTSNLKKPKRFRLICYRAINPEKGSVKVIWVHRLCGVPGDIVEIKAGILYVNKQAADEGFALRHVYKINAGDVAAVRYDPKLAYTIPPYSDTIYAPLDDKYVRSKNAPCQQYILPAGLRDPAIYQVYRKNWNQDNFGPVKVPAGKFFVLGDNRGNCQDSRYRGMIDQSKYVGTVLWK